MNKFTRINEAIRAPRLRVIDESGQQLGVLERREALAAAEQAGLDLVELSPDANPPVAKIVDWGKYNYQRTKQLQKSKRNTKVLEIKQMRFGLKISDHDLEVKCNKIREFLDAGNKTKILIVFRGRELAHKELGQKLVDRILNVFGDTVAVDHPPQFAGKQLSFVIRNSSSAKLSHKKVSEKPDEATVSEAESKV